MNEFCAAMGICNLRHIDSEIKKRRVVCQQYWQRLDHVAGLKLNPTQKDVQPNFSYFPVLIDKQIFGRGRDQVYDCLEHHGIHGRKYFYPLTNTFPCFHGQYDVNQTPQALKISENILTLPLYADLSLNDVDRICDVVLACKK